MKLRDVIFWMHLISGLSVGLIVLIMSVTGSMLAFRSEIINVADRHVLRVTPSSEVGRFTIHEWLSTIKKAKPDLKPAGVKIFSDPTASVAFNLGRGKGDLYINPYTGNILGQDGPLTEFLEKVETWHRWLGMEGKLKPVGHHIKGVSSIIFLFIVISGFYLWWPKQWHWKAMSAIVVFNPLAQGKAKDWNWHNVIGFWSAPFLIVIILTGIIMSYSWANDLLYKATGNAPPVKRSAEMSEPIKKELAQKENQSINYDALIVKAQTHVPDWKIIQMRFPKQYEGVTINIEDRQSGFLHRRSTLVLDPTTAEVIRFEPYSEHNLGRVLRTWVRYSHTGEAGGVVGKIFAFLAACGAVVLIWTGCALAWRRFFTT